MDDSELPDPTLPETFLRTLTMQGVDLDMGATQTIGRSLRQTKHSDDGGAFGSLPDLELSEDHSAMAEFAVLGELGAGGMGVVQLARQTSLGREVAIKRLLPNVVGSAHADLLLREARITGQLEHPNIVPVHSLGLVAGEPVVVMKRVQGEPWSTLVSDRSTPIDEHIEILVQLCGPLQFAHSRGVIHCDLKPDNVMLGPFGEVYLLDWGVALQRSSGARPGVRGTPGFMPPELALGLVNEIDARTDVYLLGACLHNTLTGELRHDGETLLQVLVAAASSKPVEYGTEVPAGLAAICNRACAPTKADRFDDVFAFRDALRQFLKQREARDLTELATILLGKLEDAIAGAAVTDEATPTVMGLFRESRFAFEYVLKGNPDLDEARVGHQRCLLVMLDYELARDRVETAEELLDTMDDPPDDRRQAIAQLRITKAAARTRLAELEHAGDMAVGQAQRGRLGLLLVAVGICSLLYLYATNRGAYSAYTPVGLAIVALLIWVVVATGTFIWRRSLFANEFSRRWVYVLCGAPTAVVLHRAVAILAHLTPEQILVGDLAVLGASCLAGAALSRILLGLSVIVFAMAIGAAAEPSLARAFMNIASFGFPLTLWWTWRRRTKNPE